MYPGRIHLLSFVFTNTDTKGVIAYDYNRYQGLQATFQQASYRKVNRLTLAKTFPPCLLKILSDLDYKLFIGWCRLNRGPVFYNI